MNVITLGSCAHGIYTRDPSACNCLEIQDLISNLNLVFVRDSCMGITRCAYLFNANAYYNLN